MVKLSEHDKKVKRIAAGYRGKGWDVRADLPDDKPPKPIHGKTPDIVATKGKRAIIVEVETDQSFDKDKNQRAIFRDYAKGKSRTKFRWTTV